MPDNNISPPSWANIVAGKKEADCPTETQDIKQEYKFEREKEDDKVTIKIEETGTESSSSVTNGQNIVEQESPREDENIEMAQFPIEDSVPTLQEDPEMSVADVPLPGCDGESIDCPAHHEQSNPAPAMSYAVKLMASDAISADNVPAETGIPVEDDVLVKDDVPVSTEDPIAAKVPGRKMDRTAKVVSCVPFNFTVHKHVSMDEVPAKNDVPVSTKVPVAAAVPAKKVDLTAKVAPRTPPSFTTPKTASTSPIQKDEDETPVVPASMYKKIQDVEDSSKGWKTVGAKSQRKRDIPQVKTVDPGPETKSVEAKSQRKKDIPEAKVVNPVPETTPTRKNRRRRRRRRRRNKKRSKNQGGQTQPASSTESSKSEVQPKPSTSAKTNITQELPDKRVPGYRFYLEVVAVFGLLALSLTYTWYLL